MGAASPVLAFDPTRWSSAMRVVDLARLGYLEEPVLDPTYGLGGMWERHRPLHLVRADLDPARGRDVVSDVCALPFRERCFGTVLFDPPFKLTHDVRARGDHDLTERFDARARRHEALACGIAECARVTRHWLIVKCQDQVEGWRFVWQTGRVTLDADECGFDLRDELHLMNNIAQPPGRPQRSARHNASTFLVFLRRRPRRSSAASSSTASPSSVVAGSGSEPPTATATERSTPEVSPSGPTAWPMSYGSGRSPLGASSTTLSATTPPASTPPTSSP